MSVAAGYRLAPLPVLRGVFARGEVRRCDRPRAPSTARRSSWRMVRWGV